MKIAEIIGPTFQGEGSTVGRRCYILRLAGCNLRCKFCDTKHAHGEGIFMPVCDVAAAMDEYNYWIITGGEPLLQQYELENLFYLLPSNYTIEIETNGTIKPVESLFTFVSKFNVSPKFPSINLDVLNYIRLNAKDVNFKFVCSTEDDVKRIGVLGLPKDKTWVMPLGATRREIDKSLKRIIEPTLRYGYNLTDRMHIRMKFA